MAENKKSVLLYCDIIHTVKSLTDEEAGRLFKHYLEYINDLNPNSDRFTELLFEPIKQNLKRDLKKWEETIKVKIKAGLASAEKRKQNQQEPTHVESVEHEPTKPTVNVTVTDTVNVSDTVTVKDKTIKDVAKENLQLSEYQVCVDFWLMEFHQGWTFTGQHGKALKSIILKIKKVLKDGNKEINKDSIFESFKFICLKLPDWYKTKDLQILDSKFNEIIQEIKTPNNGKQSDTNNRKQSVSDLKKRSETILDEYAAKNSD